MSENSKRTYTVPVLLVIVFVLSILIVVSYSKYLLHSKPIRRIKDNNYPNAIRTL